MAGWSLKSGVIINCDMDDDQYWSLFNYVFSEGSRKRSTYKFGLIKSLLDNLYNGEKDRIGVKLSYDQIFEKFTENYWNLIVKYNLRQMRKDGRSQFSKIETILRETVNEKNVTSKIEFASIDKPIRDAIIHEVTSECKKNVIGALYEDFEGTLYGFNHKDAVLHINYSAYRFVVKYSSVIEKLNYYAWARFLESINTDDAATHIIDKLELSAPKRKDLAKYRELFRDELKQCNCFYCGKQLSRTIHVDHFIPWSFMKDDKAWNLVLACPLCNTRKKDRIPRQEFMDEIMRRNRTLTTHNNPIIQDDFKSYDESVFKELWVYAKDSGFKEMR